MMTNSENGLTPHLNSETQMLPSESIYLDYNSTTPLAPEVLETMVHVASSHWMNPSSCYDSKARTCIDNARREISSLLNVDPYDIIFTSGGTEANLTVINSIAELSEGNKPQVVTSAIEHPSILAPLRRLAKKNVLDLTIVEVDPNSGIVDPDNVIKQILPNRVVLISIMLANNETGAIMPVETIVSAVRQLQQHDCGRRTVYIHSDIAQAVGKIPVDLHRLGVDYATVVGHKFYGPRIGCLYARNVHLLHRRAEDSGDLLTSVPLIPLFVGGGQEFGLRAGTENTPMIAGLGKAAQLVSVNLTHYMKQMLKLRCLLEQELHTAFPNSPSFPVRAWIFGIDRCTSKLHSDTASVSASGEKCRDLCVDFSRLPNTVNVIFTGPISIDSRDVLARCPSLKASRGAACHSSHQDSSVLQACGYSAEEARSAIRLSVGLATTEEQIMQAVKALKLAIIELLTETSVSY